MERIVLVPEEMERAAEALRGEASRLRACGDHVCLAADRCCAPVNVVGAVTEAAAAVRARTAAVADALDDDARELDQRAALARLSQQIGGLSAGSAPAPAAGATDPAVDALSAATLAALVALLQQLLAGAGAVPAPATPTLIEAVVGGSVVGGTGSIAPPGGIPGPVVAVIGGSAPLGLSIVPGSPSSGFGAPPIESGTVGGSWSTTATDAIGYIATPGPMVTAGGRPSARRDATVNDLMARMVVVPDVMRDLARDQARAAISLSNLNSGSNRDPFREVP